MSTLGVCLGLAAVLNAAVVFVPTTAFTLAWTHSIEKVRWEEDYTVQLDPLTRQPALHATQARIKGSAAGMEPPSNAVLRNGWYTYTPTQSMVPELLLTRSEFTADYDWCMAGRCQPLSNFIASDTGITRASACFDPEKAK